MTAAESLGSPAAVLSESEVADGSWMAPRWRRKRGSGDAASLRKLEAYILSDEASLLRQRAILNECDGANPARAIAEATIAEYERALQTLYRRRARLIQKSISGDRT